MATTSGISRAFGALAIGALAAIAACSGTPVDEEYPPAPAGPKWVWSDPLPQGNHLTSVWVSPSGTAYAAGHAGTVLKRENGEWRMMKTMTADNLADLHGTSDDNIITVGVNGTIMAYNGRYWYFMDSGGLRSLTGVWAHSASRAYVVGSRGTLLEFDGDTWHHVDAGTDTSFNCISGTSPSNLWVGGNDGIVLHNDGTGWSRGPDLADDIDQIYSSGPNDVYAVTGTALNYFDGTAWTNAGGTRAAAIFGAGPDDIYATLGATVKHFDGQSWSQYSCGSGEVDNAIALAPGGLVGVGNFGRIVEHHDDETCDEVVTGTDYNLQDVWFSAPDDGWAVGGRILHYDGVSWEVSEVPLSFLFSIDGRGPDDIAAVVRGGGVLSYDGTDWTFEDLNTPSNMSDIWLCDDSDEAWTVGWQGAIYHDDGTGWSRVDSVTTKDVYDVWCASSNDVFMGGEEGLILRYRDGQWSEMANPSSLDLICIWGTGPDNVYAGGWSWLLHYDGTDWRQIDYPFGPTYYNIWGTGPDDIYVVGSVGTILHYDGATWSSFDRTTNFTLFGVWGSSPTDIFAVGRGAILRYRTP